ncbi:hypothetical protein EHEL_110990 [Encephalitozoon hellem ATCC 50504]|uniref:Uncharacterized protein n=1 Tax=Encephalitozoon hellem TaxID=27973 RepID=A0A9Q9F946_ENCHE|nr:uncharacterized protein EHEL_110990 [Encephalitozoon hellem ATCC 50504]AFM99373.1 hypothetical protein EHEL_110990 [Encephalitozoon hellem ATCC 50504]UTX44379.1 hypothetical protein GPU96_11g21810 [Encephalitozoon hellem]|eukprot:XP_003888354.1 hypothetical protein EHEL_110990 [Encephalitozoon hellem ATCC 50504]
MGLFADENEKKPLPAFESIQDATLKSPDTSQQLGKYIVNGLEMLSLSDIKVVVDGKGGAFGDSISDDRSDTLSAFGTISAESNGNEDCVYLSSIYKTYMKVNEKIDKLIRKEYFDEGFIKHVLAEICKGDLERAKRVICRELKDRDPLFSVETYCAEEGACSTGSVSRKIDGLLGDLRDVEEISHKLRRMFFDMRSKSFEAELGYARSSGEVVKQLDKCSRELEDLRRIGGAIAKDVAGAIEDFGIDVGMEGDGLHDVSKALKNVFKSVLKRIKTMELMSQEAQLKEREYENVLKDYAELKGKMDRIANENASFSEAVSRLSTKNTRIKKDYDAAREALKKAVESNKKKSVTIDRQKKIIDVLQSRIGDECILPVNELQSKIDEIRRRVDAELDMGTKRRLEEEMADYERRMSDFLSLLNKTG